MISHDRLLKEYLNEKAKIERDIKRKIMARYKSVANDYMKRINSATAGSMNEEYLKRTAKYLEDRYKEISKEINADVSNSIEKTVKGFTNTQINLYSNLCPALKPTFEEMFSRVNEKVLREIITGNMYKDKITLSQRLWTNNKKTLENINNIIADGMIAKKNSKLIAKELEAFVNPKHLKEYEKYTIHPKSKNKVEYNSYRLANTYINHAYQTAAKESAKKNPYVEKIIWISGTDSNVCDLCKSRNGKRFDKDKVPLDHPLGRCTLGYKFEKDLTEIAKELKDWNNGVSNPMLDDWFREYGVDFI